MGKKRNDPHRWLRPEDRPEGRKKQRSQKRTIYAEKGHSVTYNGSKPRPQCFTCGAKNALKLIELGHVMNKPVYQQLKEAFWCSDPYEAARVLAGNDLINRVDAAWREGLVDKRGNELSVSIDGKILPVHTRPPTDGSYALIIPIEDNPDAISYLQAIIVKDTPIDELIKRAWNNHVNTRIPTAAINFCETCRKKMGV